MYFSLQYERYIDQQNYKLCVYSQCLYFVRVVFNGNNLLNHQMALPNNLRDCLLNKQIIK